MVFLALERIELTTANSASRARSRRSMGDLLSWSLVLVLESDVKLTALEGEDDNRASNAVFSVNACSLA